MSDNEANVPPGGDATVPLLSLDNVTTYYGQMRILEGISLQVREGELVCLLGGNASGKSTTLKTILGIVRPRDRELHQVYQQFHVVLAIGANLLFAALPPPLDDFQAVAARPQGDVVQHVRVL